MLTYGKAKEILAKYNKRGGTCIDDPSLDLFVLEVLQYMLFKGTYGNLREFSFFAHKGCITVPYELEAIEKVKINGVIGSAWNSWFTFHSAATDFNGCPPVAKAVFQEQNYYPTIYDVPAGGARVGVFGTCNEAPNATVVVQGIDPTGRQIITDDGGEQVVGERLKIRKGEIRYTEATFAQITGIVKTKTVGYTQLLWINPGANLKGFLADYSPLEEVPAYRRYRLTDPCCTEGAQVIALGRIRLKETYSDNDIIPFEAIHTINMAGQAINLSNNRALDLAQAADNMTTQLIEDENSYKKTDAGQPVEFFLPLSGGAIGNIVGYGGGFRGRWR